MKTLGLVIVALAVTFAAIQFAGAAPIVVYRQTFGTDSDDNLTMVDFNWVSYMNRGADAPLYTGESSGSAAGTNVDALRDLPAVNATLPDPNYEGPLGRVFFTRPGASFEPGAHVLFTNADETAAINNAYTGLFEDIVEFEFDYGNTNTNITLRIFVQVDDLWYASATGFSNAIGGSASYPGSAGIAILPTDTALWHLVAGFDPGVSMGVIDFDSSVTPTGEVGAYGLMGWWTGAGIARFDNFTVTAIPEPASMLLLAAGVGSILIRRRNTR